MALPRRHRRLRLLSPTTYLLERLFAGLQKLSIADLVLGTREAFHGLPTSVAKVHSTVKRSRAIEAYIALWVVWEALSVFLIPRAGRTLVWGIRLALAYRVFEIMQATLNLNVFSALRFYGRPQRVASHTRTLVLSIWNFFELAICFGTVYRSAPSKFCTFKSGFDPYYFSVVTQLTIGYGDIKPLGVAKLLVVAQGLCSFVLALVVLSRLVAVLPSARPVLR